MVYNAPPASSTTATRRQVAMGAWIPVARLDQLLPANRKPATAWPPDPHAPRARPPSGTGMVSQSAYNEITLLGEEPSEETSQR